MNPIPIPYLSAHPTGSRYTVTPAVLTTDDDWLVLVVDLNRAGAELVREGYLPCRGGDYMGGVEAWSFEAYRRGDVNLIVTDDKTMYLRSVGATLLAAKLNLTNKEDRVALFRRMRFGTEPHANDYEGPLP